MKTQSVTCAALAAVLACAAHVAQADDLLPLPPAKRSGEVTYTSGGIPDEQLPAVKQARASYPLVIELFQKSGQKNQYTSDVQVRLIDAKGNVVLDDKAEGPFFLVKPAPGTYRVEATFKGRVLEQRGVAVGASGSRRVVFVFPES